MIFQTVGISTGTPVSEAWQGPGGYQEVAQGLLVRRGLVPYLPDNRSRSYTTNGQNEYYVFILTGTSDRNFASTINPGTGGYSSCAYSKRRRETMVRVPSILAILRLQ